MLGEQLRVREVVPDRRSHQEVEGRLREIGLVAHPLQRRDQPVPPAAQDAIAGFDSGTMPLSDQAHTLLHCRLDGTDCGDSLNAGSAGIRAGG